MPDFAELRRAIVNNAYRDCLIELDHDLADAASEVRIAFAMRMELTLDLAAAELGADDYAPGSPEEAACYRSALADPGVALKRSVLELGERTALDNLAVLDREEATTAETVAPPMPHGHALMCD